MPYIAVLVGLFLIPNAFANDFAGGKPGQAIVLMGHTCASGQVVMYDPAKQRSVEAEAYLCSAGKKVDRKPSIPAKATVVDIPVTIQPHILRLLEAKEAKTRRQRHWPQAGWR